MENLVKYICFTRNCAFDLMAYIADNGGDAKLIMNGEESTRCVLSTYSFDKLQDLTCLSLVSMTQEPSYWDVNYFNEEE